MLQRLGPCHPVYIKLILHSYFYFYFRLNHFLKYATSVAGFWKKTEAIFLKYHQRIILLLTRIWALLSSIYLLQSTYTFDDQRWKNNFTWYVLTLWQMIICCWIETDSNMIKRSNLGSNLPNLEELFLLTICFWSSKWRSRNADYSPAA